MSGVWIRAGSVAVTNGSTLVTGTGTAWLSPTNGPQKGHLMVIRNGATFDIYEIDRVVSATQLRLVDAYRGTNASGREYAIDTTRTDSIPEFARRLAATLSYHQANLDVLQQLYTSTAASITVTAPDGTQIALKPWKALESIISASLKPSDAESGSGKVLRDGGPALLDGHRRAVERASGGKRTIIYDTFGNANTMNVFHKTTYENHGKQGVYGSGLVQAFQKSSGADFSEVFLGTFQSSGNQFVSEARAVPRTGINYDDAINGHKAKGAGWGTVSRWDWALLLLEMESLGFQPRGNTNHGAAHDAMHESGQRQDNALTGDSSGIGNILTGTGPDSWNHDGSPHGVADLVGNVWEWVHGFKLLEGRIMLDPYNNQGAESSWVAQAAYINGPSPILAASKTAETTGSTVWSDLQKAGGYVSNQLLKRAMIEPAGQALNGRFYVNNSGERLPLCGGSRNNGGSAGPAALYCLNTRTYALSNIGSRARFAV